MERVVDPENMERAYRKVIAKKGAPGVDGITVYQLRGHGQRCVSGYWPVCTTPTRFETPRPQTQRQNAAAWDTHGHWPADPAIANAKLRPDLLRVKLRLSPQTQR